MNEIQKELLAKLNEPAKELKKEAKELTKAEKNYQDDYEFTRKKLKALISKGEIAVEEMLGIALETKDPYTFKVMSELLGTLKDLSTGVIETAKQKSDIDHTVSGGQKNIGTQNNAIFIGNAHELLELIKEEEKKEEELQVIDITPEDENDTDAGSSTINSIPESSEEQ